MITDTQNLTEAVDYFTFSLASASKTETGTTLQLLPQFRNWHEKISDE